MKKIFRFAYFPENNELKAFPSKKELKENFYIEIEGQYLKESTEKAKEKLTYLFSIPNSLKAKLLLSLEAIKHDYEPRTAFIKESFKYNDEEKSFLKEMGFIKNHISGIIIQDLENMYNFKKIV